jgi:hypothetical protein
VDWGRFVWVETGLPITIGLVHDFLTIAMRPAMTASPWTERHPVNRTR